MVGTCITHKGAEKCVYKIFIQKSEGKYNFGDLVMGELY
jgi:hypothetical protein